MQQTVGVEKGRVRRRVVAGLRTLLPFFFERHGRAQPHLRPMIGFGICQRIDRGGGSGRVDAVKRRLVRAQPFVQIGL